ncbi:UDP-N-acetylmuramoyl-L-alanyl-D-glutamate--2,6-diaminopimelate ligase [Luteimonas pelagia]
MSGAMSLARLLPDVPGVPDVPVARLVQDSRALRAGDAFVAIPPVDESQSGLHGLQFVDHARAAGAVAILFEPPAPDAWPAPADAIPVPGLRARLGAMADTLYGRPTAHMRMAGVTGTNGKTSTVQLLAQAWQSIGMRSATIGTLGAGLHGREEATGFTTPLVLHLHALLAELHAAGAEAVAMEVSSHALDQGRVDGVHFDVAVFTNLSRDHLDYHGDMAAYGAAKAKLFAWPGLGAAVLNLDDAFGRELAGALPDGVRAIGVSTRGATGATLMAEGVELDQDGLAFDLVVGGARHPVRSPLLGRFNVDNLLAVAGVLHAAGEPAARIAAILGGLKPIRGRMNRLGGDGLPLVVVDYAHTPDALEQALATLRAHAPARILCVFGCGGERDTGKRPEMGAIAAKLADLVVVTDDNPRSEDGDAIVAGILAGIHDQAGVAVLRDRRAAIARAIGQARADDIVLVAGKGHEPYQEIDGVRHPFDDTAVARDALEAWQ